MRSTASAVGPFATCHDGNCMSAYNTRRSGLTRTGHVYGDIAVFHPLTHPRNTPTAMPWYFGYCSTN
jgi:hypothetical protein